ncbi:MAG TPA: hypothetical protein ENK98_09820 [Epsilonproteobacteria bacterium]|nr:hypothetical protein [Campylobacterota bacterium]
MKKVTVVKSSEMEVKPFVLDDFIQVKQMHGNMSKITKKDLKHLADDLGLKYDDKQIGFTKKLITAYLERQG